MLTYLYINLLVLLQFFMTGYVDVMQIGIYVVRWLLGLI